MLDIGPSPAATLMRHMDTDEFDLQSLNHQTSAAIQSRPMTLPTRGSAAQRVRKAELAKLSRQRFADDCGDELLSTPTEACESPSYMTHTANNSMRYKFPDADSSEPSNPIPLPPREGKKQVKTSTKRHVRKYPLIIPANGLQRTLSKLTDFGETETASGLDNHGARSPQQEQPQMQTAGRPIEVVAAVRRPSGPAEREYENMPKMTGSIDASHTYQNLDKLMPADAAGLTVDSASLQFESILEADISKESILQSPDVTDGFYNFSIQKEEYNKGKEIGGEINLNVETKKIEQPPQQTEPEESTPSTSTEQGNELAGNALFKKVRASVNQAMTRHQATTNGDSMATSASTSTKPQTEAEYFAATAARLAHSNSVSCEDLLEFSDKKPKGCERGVDSDEVRIMVKVLGKASTPQRCLSSLEFINWDVHKSIKLIKLQNMLESDEKENELSLESAFEALQEHEWDLHTTAQKLKSLKL